MITCNIIYTARDLVGNNSTVKAELFDEEELFKRLKDVIEVTIDNGASMSDSEISTYVLDLYNSQL